eukprot:TRINITY_DN3589_c1_g3_i2.p1 TRINITY_DN3589_c1_g3~~TRINITY_DN3589_c1_g3_i2.p1  ORF type:complete len:144 (-),score=32.83 TRINITY_DN3589_c1_g3_i2:82-513(-)
MYFDPRPVRERRKRKAEEIFECGLHVEEDASTEAMSEERFQPETSYFVQVERNIKQMKLSESNSSQFNTCFVDHKGLTSSSPAFVESAELCTEVHFTAHDAEDYTMSNDLSSTCGQQEGIFRKETKKTFCISGGEKKILHRDS